MRKKYFYAAAMAAMLASCSESFEAQQPVAQSQTPAVAGETPVSFGIYTNRGTQGTRGGATGALTTDGLKDHNGDIGRAGFGVFAYYTDNLDYTGSTKPNFMYNQQVTYAGSAGDWTYEPVKYWPNEYGSHAESADEDKVSFFAYAPYFACDPATGSVVETAWGISGFSKNTASGDPIVKYTTSFNLMNQVDLCWAVKNGGTWNTLTDQGSQTIANGYAWKDVEHPATIEQKMLFHFRHALAQLNVQIDADADLKAHQDGSEIARGTKVYVRSISFNGFAQKGALNLNNTASNQPLWLNFNGQGELQPASSPVVINDGRKNGKEGTTDNTSEAFKALNPNIVQSTEWGAAEETPGVTGTLQNLFSVESLPTSATDEEKAEAPIYVIPTGEDALTVTIAYDVETEDANLAGYLSDGKTHGSSVQNVITKEITFGSNNEGLKAGNNYQVKLHLGLNSVKFDVTLEEWNENAINADGWLPANTGEGVSDPANPLTIHGLGAAAPSSNLEDQNLTGAQATSYTISGMANDLTVGATHNNTWTIEDPAVAQIAATTAPSAPSRAFAALARAFTREGEAQIEWTDKVEGAQYILIHPVSKGTTKLTATDGAGHTSTCIITVDATEIKLYTGDESNKTFVNAITLYDFEGDAIDADKVTLIADIKKAASADEEDAVASWEIAAATEGDDVSQIATIDGGVVTPVGEGNAIVTVKTTSGASATCNVTVKKPSITLNNTNLYLVGAAAPSGATQSQLSWTAEPADVEVVITESNDASAFEWNEATRTVKGAAKGEGSLTFAFKDHESESMATCNIYVQVTDPGVALNEEGGKALRRILVSDVANSYASVAEAKLWNHTPIAVIAAKGENLDGSYSFLAMAINDLPVTYVWATGTAATTAFASWAGNNTKTGNNYNKPDAPMVTAYNGSELTSDLVNAATAEADYPAAKAAKEYSVAIPTDIIGENTGWFLPSIGQWNVMIQQLCGSVSGPIQKNDGSAAAYTWELNIPRWTDQNLGYMANGEDGTSGVNSILVNKLGVGKVRSSVYWSSSENGAERTWSLSFARGAVGHDPKSSKNYVRPVLAF